MGKIGPIYLFFKRTVLPGQGSLFVLAENRFLKLAPLICFKQRRSKEYVPSKKCLKKGCSSDEVMATQTSGPYREGSWQFSVRNQ